MAKMRDKQHSGNDEPVNYWRSTADLLMALLLLLFLLLSVFMYRSNQAGDYTEAPTATPEPTNELKDDDEKDIIIYQDANGGGGGAGGAYERNEYTGYNEITMDGEIRAAVRIVARDLDTGEQIEMENLHFQLRDLNNNVLTLSTYYPEIKRFKEFVTTANGSLYLPERIREGNYLVTSLDAPLGYQRAETEELVIEKDYEWNQPIEVVMYFALMRNEIYVRVVDAEQQKPITGVEFTITVTSETKKPDDGLIYQEGQVIGKMITGINGTARSEELALGEYILNVVSLPKGYACPQRNEVIDLKTADEQNEATQIELHKTQMTVTVKDELNRTPIAGITLSVSDGKNETTYITDQNGSILLIDLEKETEYTVHQTTVAEDYRLPSEEIRFTVDQHGWINQKIEEQQELRNRIIQVNFTASDLVLGRTLVNEEATLLDASGQSVAQWATGERAKCIKGLEPGQYTYRIGSTSKEITILDIASVQNMEIRVLTTQNIVMIGGCALLGIALIISLVLIFRKKKK